ncbi:MAG: alpha/beta hydrolase [Planctomycetes bacterium]|nr:alpha/beta hydrolase [Planctomycetota bacterium]
MPTTVSKSLLMSALLIGLANGNAECAEPVPQVTEAPSLQETSEVALNTAGHETGKRGFKHWLRSKTYSPAVDSRYGLKLEEGWEQAAEDLPMVVLIHGYNSGLENNSELLSVIRKAGFPCAGFAYPNDFYVEDSAQRLSRELRAFKQQHKNRRLALVTHSMGGLVALECLENKQLDPGNVERLIMIAPPTQGTLLAQVAIATDVWEHWLGRKNGTPWTRWHDSVADGLGEAADDLVPGSPFLNQLNSRLRNENVQYTIFLGTGASVAQDEMDWLRAKLRSTSGYVPGTSGVAEQLDQMLGEMDELIDGKGDGIVAVKRGQLQGVDDVVVLPFGHLSVTGKAEDEVVRQVQQEVLERLH